MFPEFSPLMCLNFNPNQAPVDDEVGSFQCFGPIWRYGAKLTIRKHVFVAINLHLFCFLLCSFFFVLGKFQLIFKRNTIMTELVDWGFSTGFCFKSP